jgi:hypothetical protein
VDTQHHFTKDKVFEQEVALTYIRTTYTTTNIFTKSLSKEKHQLCVTHLGMSPISHFFVSRSSNTQALMTILYNNKDQFWSGRRYHWSFVALRNANYFIKIYPLCKENESLVSNFHV